MAVIKKKKKRK